jgi:hypothetical protein
MAFDLKSIRKNDAMAAPRIMVYGVEGIGKINIWCRCAQPRLYLD